MEEREYTLQLKDVCKTSFGEYAYVQTAEKPFNLVLGVVSPISLER